MLFCLMGPSIKYIMIFLANFYPPCHTSSHIPGPPPKYVTHLGPPRFFSRPSTKSPDKSPLYKFSSIVFGVFVREGLSEGIWFGRFCQGWFLSIPPSVTIHLLQQKVKHHFKFYV